MQHPGHDSVPNDELISLTVVSHAGVMDLFHGGQVKAVPLLLVVMGGNDSNSCCLPSSFSAGAARI